MTLLTIRNLGVTFGIPLFSDLTLTLHPGDRIGVVAANGRGKTTLLRCITGSTEATSGEITRARGLRIGHVAQDIPPSLLPLSVLQAARGALNDASEDWRADVALDELQVPPEMRGQMVGSLSQGWQRMVLLARAWVAEPDLLLLDEPTNHLDLTRIGQVEAWIAALPRDFPLLLCSHDRAFLEATTNRTLFLRPANSVAFALPYGAAREALTGQDAATDRQHQQDIRQAQQLRRQAAKLKNIGINSGSDLLITKTKQLKDRADRLEAAARPAHREGSAGAIRLGNSGSHARALLRLEDAQISAPDGRNLFRTGTLWISPGDRVVVLGRNGTGKTRLMEAVLRAIRSPGDGPVSAAPTLVLGHCDQTLSHLDPRLTAADHISRHFDVGDQVARTLLAGAGLDITLQGRRIGMLSGGQKARLSMLGLRLAHPNFYLLDEPTNHLDIEGQEALERELTAHGATCLVVSHDRSFIRAVGTRFWQVEQARLVEVEGPEAFFAEALAG